MSATPQSNVVSIGLAPNDVDSEEHTIGAALIASSYGESTLVSELVSAIEPHMFFREKNAEVWAAISDLANRGAPVNQSTVIAELRTRGQLDGVGIEYLEDCARQLPTTVGAAWYAEQVREAWVRRCTISVAHGLAQAVSEPDSDPVEVTDEWLSKLLRIGDVGRSEKVVEAADYYANPSALVEFLNDPSAIRGIRSPWMRFDRSTGGLRATNVYVVMADTSIGKSLFVQQIALHSSLNGNPTVVATGEMSHEEVFDRLVFMHAGIDPQDGIKNGGFTPDERGNAMESIATLEGVTLPVINDLSLPNIVSQTRRLVRAGKCELLVIDHIQHVTVPKSEGRVDTIERAMKELKALALSERIPVFVVSHTNRASKEFGLSNSSGKNSSSIEQDANVTMSLTPGEFVAGVWQPFETAEEHETSQREKNYVDMKLRFMKQRGGIKGSIVLRQDWNRGGKYFEVER